MNDNFFRNINKILAQVDPINLIETGAPTDEYSNEAAQIARFMKSDNTTQLKEYISLLFNFRFNISIKDNKLDQLINVLREQTSENKSLDE